MEDFQKESSKEKKDNTGLDGPVAEHCDDCSNHLSGDSVHPLIKSIQNQFQCLACVTFEGIAVQQQGRVIEANQQYADMFGYSRDEIIGMNLSRHVAPESQSTVREQITCGNLGPYEATGLRKNGKKFPVEIRIREVQIDGEVIRVAALRDLTAQKQHTAQIEAVFGGSEDCIMIIDRDYNYLYANQASIDFVESKQSKPVGYKPGHIEGLNMLEVLSDIPDAVEFWTSRVGKVFETGRILHSEDAFSIEGHLFYGYVVITPIFSPNGEVVSASILFRDITQSKQHEQQLRAVFESSLDGMIVLDLNLIHLYVNQRTLDYIDKTRDEVIGKSMQEVLGSMPELYETWKSRIEAVIQHQHPMQYEDQILRDGQTFTHQFILFPIKYPDGEIFAIGAIERDVTKRKQLQLKLEESEAKYRRLYLDSPVALGRTRISDGKPLECNHAMARLLGYESREAMLETGNALVHHVDPDCRMKLIKKLTEEKRVDNFEIQLRRRDGRMIWVETSVEMFSELDYIEGTLRNISVSKLLTRMQKKILHLIHQGKSNKEIARELNKSVRTVEDHRRNLMKKLDVDNIVDLLNVTKSFIANR